MLIVSGVFSLKLAHNKKTMKQNLSLVILLFIAVVCYPQTKGIILDKVTLEPVPYANIGVENSIIGATSDLTGHFLIKAPASDNRLIISAIGYATQYVTVSDKKIEVMLEPRVYEIEEVVVRSRNTNKQLVVNALERRKSNHHLASSGYPWISARYFEYRPEYKDIPFVKKLKILTDCGIASAKFNVRIINANEKGEPVEDIFNENIIVSAKKGNRIVTVSLVDKNLLFPKNGFFVALEWLIIDENKREYSYTKKGEKGKHTMTRFEPMFGVFKRQGTTKTWTYTGGKWSQRSLVPSEKKGQYLDLAVELLLTD